MQGCRKVKLDLDFVRLVGWLVGWLAVRRPASVALAHAVIGCRAAQRPGLAGHSHPCWLPICPPIALPCSTRLPCGLTDGLLRLDGISRPGCRAHRVDCRSAAARRLGNNDIAAPFFL